MDYTPILAAVRQSAQLARRVQTLQAGFDKGDDDPVTIADYGIQMLINRAIAAHFPDDAIIAEESSAVFLQLVPPGAQAHIRQFLSETLDADVSPADLLAWLDAGKTGTSGQTWVIDPIDGTKGFLARRHYAIAVGLLYHGQLAGAVMGCPGHDRPDGVGSLFWGDVETHTAMRAPIDGGPPVPIRVSAVSALADVRLLESVVWQHTDSGRLRQIADAVGIPFTSIVNLDSMEKYALIAEGGAELLIRLPRSEAFQHHIWDHAAGAALVVAAGGEVSDLDGTPLDFGQGSVLPHRGILVSNGAIHARIAAAIRATEQQGA